MGMIYTWDNGNGWYQAIILCIWEIFHNINFKGISYYLDEIFVFLTNENNSCGKQ